MSGTLNGSAGAAVTPRQIGEERAKVWTAFLEQAGLSAGHFTMRAGMDDVGTLVLGTLVEELHKRGYKVVSHALVPTAPDVAMVGVVIQTISGEPKRVVQL